MLRVQRALCPDLTFRLVHDISPENYPDDRYDGELERKKEQFILSCLNDDVTAKDKRRSWTDCMKDVGHEKDRVETIPSPREIQQKTLEQLNNVINVQFHGTEAHCRQGREHLSSSSSSSSGSITKTEERAEHYHSCSPRVNKHEVKTIRKPRKLPVIPTSTNNKSAMSSSASSAPKANEKCLADELQEALVRSMHSDDSSDDDVFIETPQVKTYPKYGGNYWNELLAVSFNTVSKNTRPMLSSDNVYLTEDSVPEEDHPRVKNCSLLADEQKCPVERIRKTSVSDRIPFSTDNVDGAEKSPVLTASGRRRRDSDDDEFRRKSSSSVPNTNYLELEVTHRGMHRFIPRHKDEVAIEIGDPLHVFKQADDLWFEAVNLRSCQRGIFPSMYATDLQFLEDDADEDGNSLFSMRFLGSVEVNGHKGDEVLCQAINKVALSRRSANCCTPPPPLVSVEISQYGIRMLDKSKSGHECGDQFTHFFALKNISFCGYHPRNERYFAFITKHPTTYRFACHVFLGEKSTRTVVEALGNAFKRFYQEYMAFTHPTEDIYME